MAHDYAREKFWQAVHGLVGSGSIEERLASAAMILIRLDRPVEDLPESVREEFQAVLHELTKETATGNEGNIAATTRKLSSEDGSDLAHRIFSIYTKLHGEFKLAPLQNVS
jgi:hypothetical protein